MRSPRSPRRLMEIVTGMWGAKALAEATRLDLFSQLSAAPGSTATEVAARNGLAVRPAEQLLTACAGLGLLRRQGPGYANTPEAETYLVRGRPDYFGDAVLSLDHRYAGWMRLGEALRSNAPTNFDAQASESMFDPEDTELQQHFWKSMYALSATSARALAAAYDFGPVRRLLDVGGGGAAYDIELCRAYEELRATVFDLPFICELSREPVSRAGLTDRISFAPGDFLREAALPAGHDAVLLSQVLHDWDERTNRLILAKCFAALPSGGRILISELLVDDTKDGPLLPALMSLNMLVSTWGATTRRRSTGRG
ncbi:methyltransferase [Streptomyces sp. MST-110588]|uniref:methyltransferase n=1 Tax=Streptomyces sp. MST-110588 TaxID=2833628 RepID=UPI001F5D53E2|nr:methyltransferase [Streptomyces sp. MST-110588]